MKNISLIIILLLTSITTFGQNEFKEIKTKKLKSEAVMNNKAVNSEMIFKIYTDKIVAIMDVPQGGSKKLAAMNLGGGTVYAVKEVENNNPKIAIYKGEGTDITIDYSGKKPEIKLELLDPSTGNTTILTYL